MGESEVGGKTYNATPLCSSPLPTAYLAGSEWAGGGKKPLSEMVSADPCQMFSVPNLLNL